MPIKYVLTELTHNFPDLALPALCLAICLNRVLAELENQGQYYDICRITTDEFCNFFVDGELYPSSHI